MADIFERLVKNYGPLGQHRERAHGYFAFPKLEGEIGSRMKFRGKEMIVWSLNNYLGLANHPEVRKTDAEATQQFGLAYPMGARMMSGNSNYHEQLERELAQFVSKVTLQSYILPLRPRRNCRYPGEKRWPPFKKQQPYTLQSLSKQ